ncbi:hypothetical protein KEM55_002950 [Ascosphaera atra]|nr:hypothetical protein KEM55_002950 [Ascosphaera atra]
MKILEPQSAVLSNVEVLAHLSLHPPRRSPPTAPNVAPNPDLRDHNTVVKEFHNYVTRLSPHLLYYPPFNPPQSNLASANILNASSASASTASTAPSSAQAAATQTKQAHTRESSGQNRSQNGSRSTGPTPLDVAIRKLISELRPFGLTKAEVLTILNLGVGLKTGEAQDGAAEGGADEDVEMGEQGQGEGEGGEL